MAKKQDELISFPMHLSREVERLFDELIHRPWDFCRELRGWTPSVDLYEATEAFIVEADLPGVKPADVQVEIKNQELVLRGSRSLEKSYSDGQFRTMERSSERVAFSRRHPGSRNRLTKAAARRLNETAPSKCPTNYLGRTLAPGKKTLTLIALGRRAESYLIASGGDKLGS